MAYSDQELTALTQRVMGDPNVQASLQQWRQFHDRTGVWMAGHGVSPHETSFRQAAVRAGLPKDVRISFQNGEPVLVNRGLPNWAYPLIIGGAAVGGIGALGGFSAPAAAGTAAGGGTAGGVGIGETGATVGLGGAGAAGAGAAAAGAGGAAAGELAKNVGGGIGDALAKLGIVGGMAGLGELLKGGRQEPPQELKDIWTLQKQRMDAQNPLYASILQLAQSRLPRSAQGAQLPQASNGMQTAVQELARRRQG